jgi:hypothetical protein
MWKSQAVVTHRKTKQKMYKILEITHYTSKKKCRILFAQVTLSSSTGRENKKRIPVYIHFIDGSAIIQDVEDYPDELLSICYGMVQQLYDSRELVITE